MSTPGGWAAPGQEPPGHSADDPGRSATGPYPGHGATQPPPGWQGQPPHTPSAGPPPGWQGQATYQPGVIPFRPLGLGDVYSAAFKIIRGNPASTVGVALILSLIALVPTTPAGVWVTRQASGNLFDPTVAPDGGSGADAALMMSGQLVPTIAASLAILALAGFIAYVTGQAVLGRKVKLPEAWRGTRPHLLRVVGAALLVGLMFVMLTVALIAPGIVTLVVAATQEDSGMVGLGVLLLLGLGLLLIAAYLFLWTRVAFIGPAIVLERQSIIAAVRRSWRLTRFRGGFWRILGIRLLTMLIVWLAAQILTTPLSFILVGIMFATGMDPQMMMVTQVIITSLSTLIISSLTTPVSATVDTLLYVDHRMRDEALDVHLMQAVDGQAALPWLPATEPLAADRS